MKYYALFIDEINSRKRFKSNNDLNMMEGYDFVWEERLMYYGKDNKYYNIVLHNLNGQNINISIFPEDDLLTIGGVKLHCTSLKNAESYIPLLISAKQADDQEEYSLYPIFQKQTFNL